MCQRVDRSIGKRDPCRASDCRCLTTCHHPRRHAWRPRATVSAQPGSQTKARRNNPANVIGVTSFYTQNSFLGVFSAGRRDSYDGNGAKSRRLTIMANELSPQILSEWLAGMSLRERARTLNRIAHELTVCTRVFEAATQPFKDPAVVIKRLIGLSELQHQLSAQIGHYMDGEEIKVYPIYVLQTFCSRRQPTIRSCRF
jgi:hypothetical protein